MDKTENIVRLVGYLGADPKVQWYDTESSVVRFSIATHSPSYLSAEGRECNGEVTDWHRVVSFRREAVDFSKMVSTGDLLAVDGRLTYVRRYSPQGQVTIHTFVVARHIELLEKKPEPKVEVPQEEPGRLDRYGRYFDALGEDKDGLPF